MTTRELFDKVLEECFSDFSTVNLGLYLLFTVTTGLAPRETTDIVWKELDLGNSVYRRRGTEYPLGPDLTKLLEEHKEYFGYQPFVFVDLIKQRDEPYHPFSVGEGVPVKLLRVTRKLKLKPLYLSKIKGLHSETIS